MYPDFYMLDANGFGTKCGTMFNPDCDKATQAGVEFAKTHNIKSSSHPQAGPRTILAIIDNQVDFCNPTWGSLYVKGAEQDTDRLCKFIFNNVDKITNIVASLDTHFLFQSFHRFTWIAGAKPCQKIDGSYYKEGEHPDPFTIITLQDLYDGVWLPVRMPNRMRSMLEKLEATKDKKKLCIWPLHCELGTPGHALEPALMEVIHWHAGARGDQYDLTEKGKSQSSEHYGILKAEVDFPDDPLTQLNTRIVNGWTQADRVYFAGQAKSHCVLETLQQVVDIFSAKSPEVLDRLYVLRDCTSSVPDIKDADGNVIVPFDQIAEERFAGFAKKGVKFVNSTDPIIF